ncbi:MAG: tRNA pseudouridine(38-40) synthase TruA [Verrucomicrobia bacterium]|nr:MAG: tRNA pseudouridine(38-40) synthase TruA [Verrucomicrobiota bacterium]
MKPETQRWKCRVAYDGTAFSGWQAQPDKNAVQDHLERRLAALLQTPVRIHGSGRTDAGVHARGQVFHFDGAWRHGPERLLAALHGGLPSAIQVQSAEAVTEAFHARFSATGKIYHYHIVHGGWADPFAHAYTWSIPRTLDLPALRAAAEVLRGRHDFRAFSAFGGEERENTIRSLTRLDVFAGGSRLRIEAEAEGFLYKMVRSLVGALVYAGSGKLTPARIAQLLASRERTAEVETAPAQGLCLERVHYPSLWSNDEGGTP